MFITQIAMQARECKYFYDYHLGSMALNWREHSVQVLLELTRHIVSYVQVFYFFYNTAGSTRPET